MAFAQPRDLSFASDVTWPAGREQASGGQTLGSSRVFLPPGPEAAKAAREFTTATLHGWDLDGLVDDAMVIASELVTNAVRHGADRVGHDAGLAYVELVWQRYLTQVICEVTDATERPPVFEPPDLDAECGRGLQVVEALAAAWGWTLLGPDRKAVWAALELALGN